MGLEGPTVLIILVIVLLLFGGKKIPELMKGLGKGVKEFKDAQSTDSEAAKTEDKPKV
jgi:sec-independent protein translocase protein TatA